MITIADSGGANLKSIEFALKRSNILYKFARTSDDLREASKILLPGVGAAKDAMERLKKSGSDEVIRSTKVPVLGICLGMQILFESSEEGYVECLGVLPGKVYKIPRNSLTLPHMGWNRLRNESPNEFSHLAGSEVYFAHSYCAEVNETTKLLVDYGIKIPALVNYKNYYGMQFHPEKSSLAGKEFLERFAKL